LRTYLKTTNELDYFDLVTVNKVFGVNGPIDVPSIEPAPKKRPAGKCPDPLQRLGRLMKLAVSQADGVCIETIHLSRFFCTRRFIVSEDSRIAKKSSEFNLYSFLF